MLHQDTQVLQPLLIVSKLVKDGPLHGQEVEQMLNMTGLNNTTEASQELKPYRMQRDSQDVSSHFGIHRYSQPIQRRWRLQKKAITLHQVVHNQPKLRVIF